MIDLELYKPNKKILDLDNEVIELWYGKTSLEFIKLLRNCRLEQDLTYFKHHCINYCNIDGNLIITYLYLEKKVYVHDYYGYKFLSNTNKIIRELFNYEINQII